MRGSSDGRGISGPAQQSRCQFQLCFRYLQYDGSTTTRSGCRSQRMVECIVFEKLHGHKPDSVVPRSNEAALVSGDCGRCQYVLAEFKVSRFAFCIARYPSNLLSKCTFLRAELLFSKCRGDLELTTITPIYRLERLETRERPVGGP